MATATDNTSAKSAQKEWFAAVKAWLKQGRVEGGITSEQALAIGRKYYEEQGWNTSEGFHAQESGQMVDGLEVPIFLVGMRVIGGNSFVHVRRADGKVIGSSSRPR